MTDRQFRTKLGNILKGTGRYDEVKKLVDEFYGDGKDDTDIYWIHPTRMSVYWGYPTRVEEEEWKIWICI